MIDLQGWYCGCRLIGYGVNCEHDWVQGLARVQRVRLGMTIIVPGQLVFFPSLISGSHLLMAPDYCTAWKVTVLIGPDRRREPKEGRTIISMQVER
jgi:hypothetical protein